MLDFLFTSILPAKMTAETFLVCLLVAVLPALIQVVIMLVNGNLGAGVAVMGAFSLVRFRSAPGSAAEISCVFLAVVVGLATGMGYIGVAVVTALVVGLLALLFTVLKVGGEQSGDPRLKELKITIPEDLNYTEVFDDLFETYATDVELLRVKTSNMGSLFQLTYTLRLKDVKQEKELLDAIRCRNGNLEIVCGRVERKLQDTL